MQRLLTAKVADAVDRIHPEFTHAEAQQSDTICGGTTQVRTRLAFLRK
jgi:hypothetical protein